MEVADERPRGQLASAAPPPSVVVTARPADFADSPAALVAVTWKVYAVEGVSPVTVAAGPVAEATFVPPR